MDKLDVKNRLRADSGSLEFQNTTVIPTGVIKKSKQVSF